MLSKFCPFVSCDISGSLRHLVCKSTVLLYLSIFLWRSQVSQFEEKVMENDRNHKYNKLFIYLAKFFVLYVICYLLKNEYVNLIPHILVDSLY